MPTTYAAGSLRTDDQSLNGCSKERQTMGTVHDLTALTVCAVEALERPGAESAIPG